MSSKPVVALTLLLTAACSSDTTSPQSSSPGGMSGSTSDVGGSSNGGSGGSGPGGVSGVSGSGGSSGGSNGGSSSGGAAGNTGGSIGASGAGGATSAADSGSPPSGWWKPAPNTSWQWQLSGTLDTSFDVAVYDIDLYETKTTEIDALHAAGRKVVCYFDTAYEPGRPDSAALAPYEGNPIDGWPGQFWVDIRQPAVTNVMLARIALAAQKHCDGIEADDVDSRSNSPGFPITKADQEGFIRALATEAHAKGLAYGLKNDLDEVVDLVSISDFAINEECFQYNECDMLTPFISAGKAVFQVEYTDGDLAAKGATFCASANQQNFDSLVKHLDLDAPRFSCR